MLDYDYELVYCPECAKYRKMHDFGRTRCNDKPFFYGFKNIKTIDKQECPYCKNTEVKIYKNACLLDLISMYDSQCTVEQRDELLELANENKDEFRQKILPMRRKHIERDELVSKLEKLSNGTSSTAVRCPRCSSTQISTGARGVSGFWGFIGASKTVNRCANCGHTWNPSSIF